MKGMKCMCGKITKYEKNLSFNGHTIDGWKCKNCKEEYYNPEKAEKILLLNKLKKRNFNLKLNKVRSNLIVRIPKEVGDALDLKRGDEVNLSLKDNKEILICAKK
jgi:AbrB family looped-hinge helix DNA binding protein